MGLGHTPDEIIRRVQELNSSAVGFSINSLCMDRTIRLIEAARAAMPRLCIIAGGPHVSTIPDALLSDCPAIDYAIVGEGEESLLQLLRGDPPEGIAGLVYRDQTGTVRVNPKRITESIDTLPFPRFARFELEAYTDTALPLLTSRGCPYRCVFCQQSSLLSKNWRGKSAAYFVEEIEYWIGRGYRAFQILDDNFAYDAERLRAIRRLFRERALPPLTLNIVGGVRVSGMTREKLALLKSIGVAYISFGVESFSDRVLGFIKKGTSTGRIETVVRQATEMGFKVRLFFIIGFPHETPQSLEELFAFIRRYPVYQARFFNLVPYQGTALMDWIDAHGRMLYPYREYMNNFKTYQDIPLFEAEHTMSVQERSRALEQARQVAEEIHARFLLSEQAGGGKG
jgi:radical SAM superfamily enzyme YgiQ (UPF0313 family)